ncbi:Glutathione S-transferase protein [Niveomyces insectorum RCEF 264]|uniref:Glutathione S-transferase protein n=1 Tax=Niveomyces insectorum RCEF 264 TaxID=1081102 RepID=A0A167ZVY2_9HYPO|nr:Glutathione S-transferase protein [Niveomyces insectorum RCEF 264]
MAGTDSVHFFDLYSTLPGASKSWSPNTLKVRAVLNFKRIPYTQSWISYPDVKPLISGFGLAPNKEGIPYTLPAILHPPSVTSNPQGAMMDSLPIARHLDATFPAPPLFPAGDASYALALAVSKLMAKMFLPLRTLIIPRVPDCLDPRGEEYFRTTRAQTFGKPLADVPPKTAEAIDALFTQAADEAKVLIEMLQGRPGKTGPFFEGATPGYADLLLACQLAFIERFGPEVFGRLLALGNGELKALYEACRPWVEGQGEDKEWPVATA